MKGCTRTVKANPDGHPPTDKRGSARPGLLSSIPLSSPLAKRYRPTTLCPHLTAGFRVSTRMGRDSIAKRYPYTDRPSLSVSNHLLPDCFPSLVFCFSLLFFSFFSGSLFLLTRFCKECSRLIAQVTFPAEGRREVALDRGSARSRYFLELSYFCGKAKCLAFLRIEFQSP